MSDPIDFSKVAKTDDLMETVRVYLDEINPETCPYCGSISTIESASIAGEDLSQPLAVVLYLSPMMKLLGKCTVSRGDLKENITSPADVMRWAVLTNSVSLILVFSVPDEDMEAYGTAIMDTHTIIHSLCEVYGFHHADTLIHSEGHWNSFKLSKLLDKGTTMKQVLNKLLDMGMFGASQDDKCGIATVAALEALADRCSKRE